MGRNVVLRGRRVRNYALGTSAIALGMALGSPASAQCTPDPTVANGTTTCTGTDADGLTVTTDNTRVTVAADAIVRPGSADAGITTQAPNTSLTIAGLVDGGQKSGILITTDAPRTVPCDPYAGASVGYCVPGSVQTIYPSASAAISISAGGAVTGSNAILLRRAPSNTGGSVSASVSNSGSITGTAGEAILSDVVGGISNLSISNTATGTITGGIAGSVSFLSNQGRIDGTSRSAIASSTGLSIENTGTIVSNGAPATLSAGGYLYVTNAAGATIGGSAAAISTSGALSLTNNGTINGSVISAATSGQSTIDTRNGTINGDLRLGAGNDTLRAKYDVVSGRVSSITGTIDGGAGTDTLAIGIDADATIARALLPTNFELLGLDLSNNATVTIASSFTSGSGISLAGYGAVINQAALVTRGPAVTGFGATGLTFTNQGTITATLDYASQFAVSAPGTLNNDGTITGIGGGGASASGSLANSGTITATELAANVSYGTLTNSSAIRSTAGTGVQLYSSGGRSTNSGTISGATTGLALTSGQLSNSGTISGGSVGVQLSGTLINAAGGTITGGIASGGTSGRVVNAGIINGNVDFTSPYTWDSSSDLFVDNGGTVSGAIRLGGGDDTLVVTLGADTSRPLAGATGGVDAGAGYDTLRYIVSADAEASLALAPGFEGLAYELSNAAALTLTAPNPLVTTIRLAGNGTVTLNGAVSTTDRSLIDATIATVAQLTGEGAGPERDLAIINNGNMALTSSAQNFGYSLMAAIYAGTADVTNNGTITVTNASGAYYPARAIFGGTTVSNAGTITVSGNGTAIDGALDVTNSGTITVSGTATNAIGISGFSTLTNSGLIITDGVAAQSGYGWQTQVTNSGTIESRLGTAIIAGYFGSIVNEAGATIRGVTAVELSDGTAVVNRGTMVGDVSAYQYSYGSSTYVADGGTLTGNLIFGAGNDTLVLFDAASGISGTINGGQGIDTLVHARRANSTVTLGSIALTGFEREGVRALGSDTEVTVRADTLFVGDLTLSGDGSVVNTAAITGMVRANAFYQNDPTTIDLISPPAFTNEGVIEGGVAGTLRRFANSGTITGTMPGNMTVGLNSGGSLVFDNSGSIIGSGPDGNTLAVALSGYDAEAITATNSGTINGGIYLGLQQSYGFPGQGQLISAMAASLTNSGTIVTSTEPGVSIILDVGNDVAGRASLINTGTIEASDQNGRGAYIELYGYYGTLGTAAIDVTNAGTIRANGGGSYDVYTDWYGNTYRSTNPAVALSVNGPGSFNGSGAAVATIANSGTIEATGERSTAILARDVAIDLTNTGTIRGGAGTVLGDDDETGLVIGAPYLAGAIQTLGAEHDRIINSGTIIGSIALGAGDDRIENYGRIEGDVFLGDGDDTFLQRASAVLIGTVDGGTGNNSLIIDATEGGAVNGDQFVNFDRFAQTGEGNVAYSGTFRFDTIGLAGGTITVAAGETLSSAGAITVTGSNGAETLDNRGTILGAVSLEGGNDRVENRGEIRGAVSLGDGNDVFFDHAGSSAGMVDGGAGIDLYQVILAGNRSEIGQRTGFEQLAVGGSGTLSLMLDQSFQQVSLAGTGLNLSLGGYTVGRVLGSDAGDTLAVDADVAAIDLGAGDDTLSLGMARAAGTYAGGAGNDTLRFASTAPVVLAGSAIGFEQLVLGGNVLTVSGTLGSTGTPLAFDGGDQQITIVRGGTLAGMIDLGARNDALRLAAGSVLNGSVSGGAGTDRVTLELAGDRALAGGTLTDFELLTSEGMGTLTLAGTHGYQRIDAGTDLALASGGSLSADRVLFGARDDRFTIEGRFMGSVDGGAGNDTIAVSGGTATAPVAFGTISNVERYLQTGGFATLAGNATFGTVDMSGGRLVGLAGSTLNSSTITVGRGATFGSAGVVNGNLAVAGTLSPGASIATMTVNGNVTLAGTSTSLFEIAATGADKLVINGSLGIERGATLELAPTGTIRPGASYDLVVASGGITGSYSTVLKPDSVFGFVVQRADRIQLLGQFLSDEGFSPQVARSIAYANATLALQPATSSLFAALPTLLTPSGASDPRAFAQLTPEAYASATQLGVDNALTLAQTARSNAFATGREDPGLFTFAQTVGQWHRLGRDTAEGTSDARATSYGFLGGIGYGDRSWMVGGFAGYLNSRQQIGALGARTKSDGFVAGMHGRYAADSGFGFSASLLYDGGEARTERTLPDTAARAVGRYDLNSWVADLTVSYAMEVGGEWALTPKLGVTYLRTTRDGTNEASNGAPGSAFALGVARDRHVAGFIDGGLTLGRSITSDAAFRPSITLGARGQIDGKRTAAMGSYAGGGFDLLAFGASRAPLIGTATGTVSYRFATGVDLFATASAQTGKDDHQETIMAGVRIGF